MITIYKYELQIVDLQEIELPLMQVLTVQAQDSKLFMWAKVATDIIPCKVKIRILGTGNPFTTHWKAEYLTSVQMGYFVWHIFIEK